MKYWFIGLLTALIVVNALLLNKLLVQQRHINSLEATLSQTTRVSRSSVTDTLTGINSSDTAQTSQDDNTSTTYTRPIETASKQEKWDYLQYLRGQNRYEELLYEVQLFLRDHPQSLDGIMLEAEAIYYTKPLNVAIIHYYELKERDLPKAQMDEVEKFIELHSSRTIQRFSGDANWGLLSAFLEPLMQVDPTNRNYIMPLAKAYGMEQQFSLMEDTLAALPFDDSRATRLRESMYSPEDTPPAVPQIMLEPDLPNYQQTRKGTAVRLSRENNKLMARARVENRPLHLLVDTGASVTALKLSLQSKIARKGEYLGIFTVQTAGGAIASPMYRVDDFYLGQHNLSNVAVMLLEDENLGDNDGLLGMNILSKFNFVASRSSDDVFLVEK